MAASLIRIAQTTVSSGVSSVSLVGIDSTYDVYKLIISGLEADTDSSTVQIRVTKSGTAQTDSEYDEAGKQLKAYNAFANNADTNDTEWGFNAIGTTTGSVFNLTAYLFNFADASEYSFATFEATTSDTTVDFRGNQNGGVHTVASASDGINVFLSTGGNIDGGTLTLYGLKK
tara:strand:- start:25 stop:543 length:519 start_codon:yes stop_codon:yes gene_type:complete